MVKLNSMRLLTLPFLTLNKRKLFTTKQLT